MNNSSNYLPTQAELDRIRSIKDEDIDLSDAPETDAKFWESAKMVEAKARNIATDKLVKTNRLLQKAKEI